MKTIKSEIPFFSDVDETLVLWGKVRKGQKAVSITNPETGEQHYLRVHGPHIKILKSRHARGAYVIVWSAAGYAWAEAVVKALKLNDYVDLIMSKPMFYMDDKHPDEFMGQRIYLKPDDSYGT